MDSLGYKPTSAPLPRAGKTAARPYDRLVQLPALIGLWPSELQDYSAASTLKVLALLRKALRSERSRGRSGHWTYDLNRHLALAESLKAERAHLRALGAAPSASVSKRAPGRAGAKRAAHILHLPGACPTPQILCGLRADHPVFLLPVFTESSS
jgi:hypothetical protein